jgi:hypothetical protein
VPRSSSSARRSSIDPDTRKIGKTEDLFRHVNDQIVGINEAFGSLDDRFTVVCECGDQACIEQIDLPEEEYERVRADSTLFVIKRGHQAESVESVVAERGDYSIVRKEPGLPAELARELDDRG